MSQCLIACSFCGLRQDQVEKLIAGPGVYICNTCVDLCSDILVEEKIPRDDARWCAARCPQGQRCELTKGHDGEHTTQRGDGWCGWPNEKEDPAMDEKMRAKDAGSAPSTAPEREPTVVDLVANLRARCDAVKGNLANDVVVLPVDLVLAIADGIEEMQADPLNTDAADRITATAAKEIVKLIVTRLFEPAKAEAESAVAAAKRLGFDAEQIATIMDPTRMSAWSTAMKVGLAASVLPMLLGVMGLGRKGGLGA